jgi:CHAT domain-containing protein/Tfp pilus assembly protein PilF
MSGPIEKQSIANIGGRLMQTATLMLSVLGALPAAATATDPPAAKEPAPLSMPMRKRLLDERDRLDRQSAAFQAQGKYAEAIAAAEKVLAIDRRVFGDVQNLDTAVRLNNLGLLYVSAADYAKAEPVCRKSCEIYKTILGETNPLYAVSLCNLAHLYSTMGAYPKAEPLLQQAREITKKAWGESNTTYAAILNIQANLYWSTGDYAKAEPLFRQALQIRKHLLGNKHRGTAESLHNLADLYQATGDYARAEPLFRQACDAFREADGQLHPEYGTALQHLAGLYRKMGDYAKAEPLARRALEIHTRALGEKHPLTADSLKELAALLLLKADYSEAQALFQHSLEIHKETLGYEHPDTIESINGLAALYWAVGDYSRAEPLCKQALELNRKIVGNERPSTASSLNNLAVLYDAMDEYAKAEPLYRQALEIRKRVLGETHPDTAESLYSLAAWCKRAKDYAQAERLCRQALEIRKKALGPNHPETAGSLSSLADLYRLMGEYAKAEPLVRQALDIQIKVLGKVHPATATSLDSLAYLYWSMRDYAKAALFCREALEISYKLLGQSLNGLAERQQLTIEVQQRLYLDNYLSLAARAGVSDSDAYGFVLESKGAITARQSLISLQRRRPELKQSFEELREVSTRLANLSLASPDLKNAQARFEQIGELTNQKESLESKLAARSSEFGKFLEAARLSPAKQLQRFEAALPRQTALVDVLEYWHSSPPRGKTGGFDFERRLLAFVVRSNGQVHKVQLGPTQPIANAVAAWRESFGEPRSSDPGKALRTLLWEPLEPFLAGADTILLSPDGPLHQLPLAALPGASPGHYLIEERNIVVLPIPRLLPQLLADSAKPPSDQRTGGPLLIGDVDFDSAREPTHVELAQSGAMATESRTGSRVRGDGGGMRFERLSGTAQEIQEISAIYRHSGAGEPCLISGREATKTAFRSGAPRHRWVHVATHGFFAPESVRSALAPADAQRVQPTGALFGSTNEVRGYHPGLLSGIVFAGANASASQSKSAVRATAAEPDDGILTALEVSGLDLSDVDLVVLSACETGLGRVAGGEGVLGLQRAFQIAGAKNVVASLWKVNDQATAALMRLFYYKLWVDKRPAAVALREAQLALLHHPEQIESLATTRAPNLSKTVKLVDHGKSTPKAETASPRLWAAFVISGSGD